MQVWQTYRLVGLALALVPFYCLQNAFAEMEFSEQDIFQQFVEVVTASRIKQSINQSPATITVITSEDIKTSGALSIPDILRYVPGLDVAGISSSHAEVSIRGLDQVPSNNVLVMIDGRSVYIDYYGGVVWEALPILIEQIDRIEVVRSPASALYGANAFSGVINILTKTPNQMDGREIFLRYGEYNTLHAGALIGGKRNESSFRVALGAKRTDSFEKADDKTDQSKEMFTGNFYYEQLFGGDFKFLLDTGASKGFVHKVFFAEPNKSLALNTYSRVKFSFLDYYVQAYWNRGDQEENTFIPAGGDENIFYNTFDIEAQGMHNVTKSNSLVYGANFRFNTIRSEVLDKKHNQKLSSLFFQDEMKLTPELSLLAGARIDWHPLVDTKFSPRASLIYSPINYHTFRLTAAKAFRNPTFLNSYINYVSRRGITFLGNPELSPESLVSYEAGYLYVPAKRAKFELNLFYSQFKEYIFFDDTEIFDPNDPFPFPTFAKIYNNRGSAKIFGGELSLDLILFELLKLKLNCSNQHVINRYTGTTQQQPPKNKANLVLDYKFLKKVQMLVGASYVGKSSWSVANEIGLYESHSIDSHTRIDCKVGYAPKSEKAQFSVSAFNLLDNDKTEYPLAYPMKRRITAGVDIRF